jgi:4a-hydroxytetrahydrobiopterin dehydratase
MQLWKRHCAPVDATTPALSRQKSSNLLKAIPLWSLVRGRIRRSLKFRDFRTALEFVNTVGRLAESEGHHPDIFLHAWNRVLLTLRTDAIHALSANDFILASKIDRLARSPK